MTKPRRPRPRKPGSFSIDMEVAANPMGEGGGVEIRCAADSPSTGWLWPAEARRLARYLLKVADWCDAEEIRRRG